MQDIRCGNCHKKLGMGEYTRLSIKCPRCGTLNDMRAASPAPERPGAPSESINAEHSNCLLDGRQAPPR
ncbi:Com family DNA-binding transcriptional regulator [Janthinobacterium aquaticum]|uniref:Com family DNA-binding transcriptional regulator n=1 Tax=Janthinobacterium sp. FT58W TaxID=2654254 RepID=UPI001263FCAD|nr:Com family DNA-binding transcriptional regulator [Janthinobacterium sp. FT58W]KAB8037403.1 Com family DNA-binding transcriptional regulator [Janthinobacterium sp. FT58W]